MRFFVFCSVLLFGLNGIAYDLESVFNLTEWKTNHKWFENEDYHERIRAYSVIIGPKETVLWLELQTMQDSCKRLKYWHSKSAYLKAGGIKLPCIGSYSDGKLHWTTDEYGSPIGWGWTNPQKGKSYFYNLVFRGSLPLDDGFLSVELCDPGENGVWGYGLSGIELLPEWSGAKTRRKSEMLLRRQFSKECVPMEGIYESLGEKCWRIGCVKNDDGTFELIFLENGYHKYWSEGDVKAELTPTASYGLFKAKWWNQAFQVFNGVLIAFDGAALKVTHHEFPLDNGNSELVFIKMYPYSSNESDVKDVNAQISGGTGFALKKGYLITNSHVVDGATDIRVWREVGGVMKSSPARIVLSDKQIDLALLKTSFEDDVLPYGIATNTVDVGENVFTLGFPFVQTMGKELKLTTGVISSLSGFKGDKSNCQVSVAVQPGNSGGPLLNDKGAVVGVVVAKHLKAENASYAIKSGELRRFLSSHSYTDIVPDGSNGDEKALSDKVKTLREYIYRIECVSGGSFVESNVSTINYPEVDTPYKSESIVESIVLTKITRNNKETILEFAGKALNGCWLIPKTVLQYGGEKLNLCKVVGIPSKKDDENEVPDDWQVRSFKAYFPPVPSDVDKVDFIEPITEQKANEGVSPFVWRGIHLK